VRQFLPRYNRHFTQPAARVESVYRPAPISRDLERILCWKETRVLARDHTFSLDGCLWQVLASERVPALTGRRIEVRRTLRNTLQAWYGSHRLTLRLAPARHVRQLLRAECQSLRAAAPADYPVRGRVRL
jgi:hypothetical protein